MTPISIPADPLCGPGLTDFALKLYQAAVPDTRLSSFIAPLNVATSLAMAAEASSGSTASQIYRTLHLQTEALRRDFKKVLHNFEHPLTTSPALTSHNALWVDQRINLQKSFWQHLRQDYKARIYQAPFRDDSEHARQMINEWTYQATRQRLNDFIPSGHLSPGAQAIFLSASHFADAWGTPFDQALSPQEAQALLGTASATHPLLISSAGDFGCFEDPADDMQILDIPYAQPGISLVVAQRPGYESRPQILQAWKLRYWFISLDEFAARLHTRLVSPRIEAVGQYSLASALMLAGMRGAFDPGQADFSQMSGNLGTGELAVSDVIHRTRWDAHKIGSEGSAATATVLDLITFPHAPVQRLGSPAQFFLRHKNTGLVLLQGKLSED